MIFPKSDSSVPPPTITTVLFLRMASTSGFNQRPAPLNSRGGRFINSSTYPPGPESTSLTPWVPAIPGVPNSSSQYTGTHGRSGISDDRQTSFPIVPGAESVGSNHGIGDDYAQGHPGSTNAQPPNQSHIMPDSQGDLSTSDQITIAVTRDKVSYVDIDITDHVSDAQSIRQEIASKVANNPHLKFDIRQIVSTESTISVPLNDDELLITCLGSEGGTLRFFVDFVSAAVFSSYDASHAQGPPFSSRLSTTFPARLFMPEPSSQHVGDASLAGGSNGLHSDSAAQQVSDPDRSGYTYRDLITNPDGNVTMPEPKHMAPATQQFAVPYYEESPITGATIPDTTIPSPPGPPTPPDRRSNIARNTLHSEPHEMTETELLQRHVEDSVDATAGIGIDRRRDHTPRDEQAPEGARIGTISRRMTMDEVLHELHLHGCKNITPYLNRSMSGDKPVASGGFGNVYRGTLNNGTEVGLKCVRMEVEFDNEGRKKVKDAARELYIWSKCKHPNVLELIGVTQHQNQIAMVSPWMGNGDLTRFLHVHPKVDRYNLCAQVADGVTYLHQESVVHGDLKAANILIAEDHTPKITDFGTASRNECTLKFTETSRSQSLSIRWTAPEIISETTDRCTIETDVFSLGMTILEMVTGTVPFHDTKDAAVVFRIVKGEHPQRPEAHIPAGNERADLLWSLLVNCWALQPQDRPTAIEVRDRMRIIASI
ncbi:hypothetical protein OPQ81_007286 [Rhizoctonia solani]|nr:hypothetical protein OPQ81_007286 [Rhizoctonia solani]